MRKEIANTNIIIKGTISDDCSLILEALDKLIEGTCCSQEDGNICTWDLLPRINEALEDHIMFEEKWIFPKMSFEQIKVHKREHRKLKRLLAAASWELECGFGDQFKSISKELSMALREHHAHSPLSLNYEEACLTDSSLRNMQERAEDPWPVEQVS